MEDDRRMGRELAMRSTTSHEHADTLNTRPKPNDRAKSVKRRSSLANRLDELTVYTFAAVALTCLAAAASGVSW